jgi:hypothetical protein
MSESTPSNTNEPPSSPPYNTAPSTPTHITSPPSSDPSPNPNLTISDESAIRLLKSAQTDLERSLFGLRNAQSKFKFLGTVFKGTEKEMELEEAELEGHGPLPSDIMPYLAAGVNRARETARGVRSGVGFLNDGIKSAWPGLQI